MQSSVCSLKSGRGRREAAALWQCCIPAHLLPNGNVLDTLFPGRAQHLLLQRCLTALAMAATQGNLRCPYKHTRAGQHHVPGMARTQVFLKMCPGVTGRSHTHCNGRRGHLSKAEPSTPNPYCTHVPQPPQNVVPAAWYQAPSHGELISSIPPCLPRSRRGDGAGRHKANSSCGRGSACGTGMARMLTSGSVWDGAVPPSPLASLGREAVGKGAGPCGTLQQG